MRPRRSPGRVCASPWGYSPPLPIWRAETTAPHWADSKERCLPNGAVFYAFWYVAAVTSHLRNLPDRGDCSCVPFTLAHWAKPAGQAESPPVPRQRLDRLAGRRRDEHGAAPCRDYSPACPRRSRRSRSAWLRRWYWGVTCAAGTSLPARAISRAAQATPHAL